MFKITGFSEILFGIHEILLHHFQNSIELNYVLCFHRVKLKLSILIVRIYQKTEGIKMVN